MTPFFFSEKLFTPGFSRKGSGGFSLTETVVVAIVFVLIVVSVHSIYTLSHRAYQEGEKSAEISQNGRVILERLSREIRQAKEIVTELSDDEAGATSTVMFQDGHDASTIHYIRYFRDNNKVKREDVAYYFTGSATPVSWNAKDENGDPPGGPDNCSFEDCPDCPPTCEILDGPKIIGEYVSEIKFWGSRLINISLILEKDDKTTCLKTKVFGRNL